MVIIKKARKQAEGRERGRKEDTKKFFFLTVFLSANLKYRLLEVVEIMLDLFIDLDSECLFHSFFFLVYFLALNNTDGRIGTICYLQRYSAPFA